MKKSTRRRPEVESLETLRLLSTMVAEAHHAAPKAASIAPGQVSLVGTIHATGYLNTPALSVEGSGSLGLVGKVSFQIEADVTNPTTTLTLKTPKGALVLSESEPLVVNRNVGTVHYKIVAGTRSYANAFGSGVVTQTFTRVNGGNLIIGGKVVMNFKFS